MNVLVGTNKPMFVSTTNAPAPAEIDTVVEGKLSAKAAPSIDGDTQFDLTSCQNGLDLRITFQALGHPRHLVQRRLPPLDVARDVGPLGLVVELVPALDKSIGTKLGIATDFRFKLHRAHRSAKRAASGLAGQRGVLLVRALDVARGIFAQCVKAFSRLLEFMHLIGIGRATLIETCENADHGARMSLDHASSGCANLLVGRWRPLWRALFG